MNANELEMYKYAQSLISSAGSMLKHNRHNTALNMKEKTCHSDIVTDQDILIENFLAGAIMEKYAGHSILAEENHCGTALNLSCYTWIIDPIDGTYNFYRYAKDYAISLALYHCGEPVFGLVYDVAADVLYEGIMGEKAAANDVSMMQKVPAEKRLKDAVIAMSFTTMRDISEMDTDVFTLLSKASAHRYLGCASLELCRLAEGDYDVYISTNVYEWDIAAAGVLVRQSGGRLISCENQFKNGKLFVAAYRSQEVWQQVLNYFSDNVRSIFENINGLT